MTYLGTELVADEQTVLYFNHADYVVLQQTARWRRHLALR